MMNKISKIIFCLIAFLMVFDRSGFANDGNNVLELLDADIKGSSSEANKPDIRISDEQIKNEDPRKIMALLEKYKSDPTRMVRVTIYWRMDSLAKLHPDNLELRRDIVKELVDVFVDPNSDVNTYKYLLTFKEADFSEESKNMISQAFTTKFNKNRSIIMCGVANVQERLPDLEELIIDEIKYQTDPNMRYGPPWYFTTAWAARLARARMGVKEDIERCIELAEAEENSTQRVLRILPRIGYIRQPEAIEYLKKYLESNKRLPPTNPGGKGELYASRAMHILAESLENFPVKQKPARNYTKEEIDLCRKWMSEQTEWKIIR